MADLSIQPGDFLTNLAASLTYDLLKYGASWLKEQALGDPEERALERVWSKAFDIMLRQLYPPLDGFRADRVEASLRYFIKSDNIWRDRFNFRLKLPYNL